MQVKAISGQRPHSGTILLSPEIALTNMLGEPRQDKPPGQPSVLAVPAAPSSFRTNVLPWYRDIQTVPQGGRERFRLPDGEDLGINIQCPAETIEGYVGLLCQEAEIVQALLPGTLPVARLWLCGSPSRQFSPEAVTELVFRLNARFPLAAMTALRGVDLPATALNAERLALLSGLGFNRVRLRIDATLGSDQRSLAKIRAILDRLTDFPAFGVHYEVRFGSRSHPRYLLRLLRAIRRTTALTIELVDPEQDGPGALSERHECGELLGLAVSELSAAGWSSYGNAFFAPPNSPLGTAAFRAAAHLTPWGPQPCSGRLWLGLGVGAFGYSHPCYYRTTEAITAYRQALEARQLPEKTLFCPPTQWLAPLHAAQTLLCRLELPGDAEPAWAAQLHGDGLADPGAARLTPGGIIRLSAIIRHLHNQTHRGDHHAESFANRHHGI